MVDLRHRTCFLTLRSVSVVSVYVTALQLVSMACLDIILVNCFSGAASKSLVTFQVKQLLEYLQDILREHKHALIFTKDIVE